MAAVIEALQPIENMVIFRFRDRSVVVAQHEAILAAVAHGDIDATVAALDEQMAYLGEKFAEAQAWQHSRATG
jgi:DNA-binding GntR family transcriptional regulator